MGSGLKAQNMTGIRAQRKGLRAQKNGIRDHKAFELESGIRIVTPWTHGKKISYHNIFPRNKVSVHRISWPTYISYSCFRLGAIPVMWVVWQKHGIVFLINSIVERTFLALLRNSAYGSLGSSQSAVYISWHIFCCEKWVRGKRRKRSRGTEKGT